MPGDRGHAQLKAAQANRRPSIETLASDAFERVAQLLGVAVDLDAPEQALFASVERAVAALVRNSQNAGAFNDLSSDCAAVASSRAVRAGHVDEVTAEDRDFVRKTLRGES